MTLSYTQAVKNGSHNIHYVYHIGGLPWFVSTSQAVIDAVMASSTTRRALFGSKMIYDSGGSDVYLADSILGFPWLAYDSLKKQTWSLADDKGMLDGGNWSVKIADGHPGKTFDHNTNSAELWGLPGLTAFARNDASSQDAYGIISSSLGTNSASVSVKWLTDAASVSAISTAITANGYALLWIGHECIAVDGIASGSFPDIVYAIARLDSPRPGRGLYRTRIQGHYTFGVSGRDAEISSAPSHSVGRHCYLWGVLLDADGAVSDYGLEREGVIGRIDTSRSVTSVSINSPLSTMRESLEVKTTSALMDRFVISRGSATLNAYNAAVAPPDRDPSYPSSTDGGFKGFDTTSNYRFFQSPHIVIHEKDSSGNWIHNAVWLCEPSETVSFDTYDDLCDAIRTELDNCWAANSDSGQINTANGSAGYEQWLQRYTVNSRGNLAIIERDPTAGISFASGPIAVYCMMGWASIGDDQFPETYAALVLDDPSDMAQSSSVDYAAATMWEYDGAESFKNHPHVRITSGYQPEFDFYTAIPDDYERPVYLHMWDWAATDRISTANTAIGHNSKYVIDLPYNAWWAAADKLYFRKSDDVTAFTAGAEFHLGGCDGTTCESSPLYVGESDSIGTDGGDSGDYPYIVPTDYVGVPNYTRVLQIDPETSATAGAPVGKTLFYHPFICSVRFGIMGDKSLDPDNYMYDVRKGDKITQDQFDQWWVRLRNSTVIPADKLSELIRTVFGDKDAAAQAPSYRCLEWVPFFNTDDTDFVSLIDYDSMDEIFVLPFAGSKYELRLDKGFEVYDAIANEILLHRAGMTYEYDATNKRWRIRFRRIGPTNASTANGLITSKQIIAGATQIRETHNATPTYNKIIVGDGLVEDSWELPFVDSTNNMLPGKVSQKAITIKPKISRVPLLTDTVTSDAAVELSDAFVEGFLKFFSQATFAQSINLTLGALYNCSLGRDTLITSEAIRDVYSHARGVSSAPISIISLARDISKNYISIEYQINGSPVYGWAPSCLVSGGVVDGDTVTLDIATETTQHAFSSTSERADAYWFDCYDFDQVTGSTSARSCSCGDYEIRAIEYNSTTATALDFTCAISGGDLILTEGTAGHAALWDDDATYVLFYKDWDSCEECQQLFIFGCDHSTHTLGTGLDKPRRWT